MWFYILKRGSTVLPTSSSALLFCLASIEYRHERTDTVKKFLCQPFKTRCFQSSKIIITSSNTESVILDSYEFASSQQGLLTGILYHRNKLIPYTCAKRSPCCVASSDVFFPLLRFIFSFRRRAISASLSPI